MFAWGALLGKARNVDLFTQMVTYRRVVEAGCFSAAARQLRLSNAAVSRQIADLEARLGCELLVRSTRKLSVTNAGRRYYESCGRILLEVEAARHDANASDALDGLLIVSAPVTFGIARVWPHLPALTAAHPALRIDLRLEDHAVDIVGEGVDVAIRLGIPSPNTTALVAHAMGSSRRVAVAAPAYLKRRGEPKHPADITDHEALVHLSALHSPSTWRFEKKGKVVIVEPRGALRTNAPMAIRDAAKKGLGLALLPSWLVDEDIAEGSLIPILRAWTVPAASITALYRAELRGVVGVRLLLDLLRRAWAGIC